MALSTVIYFYIFCLSFNFLFTNKVNMYVSTLATTIFFNTIYFSNYQFVLYKAHLVVILCFNLFFTKNARIHEGIIQFGHY